MIEPVSEALTTSIRPAWRAKNAMISSAMLPNVALRMPPTCGPAIGAEALRREADDPGQPEDRRSRDDEDERLVGVEDALDDDRRRPRRRRVAMTRDPPNRAERPEDREAAGSRRVGSSHARNATGSTGAP